MDEAWVAISKSFQWHLHTLHIVVLFSLFRRTCLVLAFSLTGVCRLFRLDVISALSNSHFPLKQTALLLSSVCGWIQRLHYGRVWGPGRDASTNNNERQCFVALVPVPPPTVPLLLLTPHILSALRHSVGCHGSLAALQMTVHSRLSQRFINVDRERRETGPQAHSLITLWEVYREL